MGACLTVANKHIPETLQWLDAQMETETMMVSVNGPIQEGGQYPCMRINEAGKYEIIYILKTMACIMFLFIMDSSSHCDYYLIYTKCHHTALNVMRAVAYEAAGVLETNSFDYLYRLAKMSMR